MGIKIDLSERLKKLPPYLFVEIDSQKKRALDEGRDIIDLGVGDPDTPTPDFIMKAMAKAIKDPSTHVYPSNKGLREFREGVAVWYRERFGVSLDPETEILPLIGSKEGIAHMPLAFINPGDVALIPNPAYPPYRNGTIFAGGEPYDMPLKAENNFLPDLGSIDDTTLNRARILFLNYPNNPTGAVCDRRFYQEVTAFAIKNNIIVLSDAAYTELSYDGYMPPSFLEAEGAKAVGVEFHSLSKTYNMTGWRIGMACGNKDIISALAKVKSNIDSGIFNAVQHAGIAALKGKKGYMDGINKMYQERRDVLIDGLNSIGWKVEKPKATFYVWARNLDGQDSISMARLLLEKADIVATPGVGFGEHGEGYVRMALTVPKKRMKEAIKRIKRII
ncbi:MAG: LL-diaminopimelate aminotransferase [Candidatus Omnitrophica bacterium]|nr:LL-diaminopimelate aminotransferase [Candidatus Omnitrophota bacterium]